MKKLMLIGASLLIGSNASAGVIGVWGYNFSTWNSYITNTGNTAVSVGAGSTAAQLSALDQVWLIRQTGDADLVDYVQNGGTLVTEWSGADWAVNTASMLDATVNTLGNLGTGTSVSYTASGAALGLGVNTGNPYSNSGATQFFKSFTGLGSDVDVVATAGSYDVGISGAYGSGNVLALGWDWQDTQSTMPLLNRLCLTLSALALIPLVFQSHRRLLFLGLG